MDLSLVPTETGVYCMFDLVDNPVYAGKSSNLRSRLRQHLIRQDSSVASYGRLDPRDIASIEWWTTERVDAAEQDLLGRLDPYLNFSAEIDASPLQSEVDVDEPDGTLTLMSDEELEFRRQPHNRVKQKIEHINRIVDKIEYADHSDDTRRAVYEHKQILDKNLQEFLGINDT